MIDDHLRLAEGSKAADANFQLSPKTIRKINASHSFSISRTPEPAFELKLSPVISRDNFGDRHQENLRDYENKSEIIKPYSSNQIERYNKIYSTKPVTSKMINERNSAKTDRMPVQLPSLNKPLKTAKPSVPKPSSNPLTHALYTYRQNLDAFHPQAYPANLSIFETHDYIEQRYFRPNMKIKKFNPETEQQLGVKGKNLV